MDYRENNLGYKIPAADEFGEIIRFKIIQQDRLDIWPHNYQYFDRGQTDCISPVENGFLKKEDNVAALVQSLYDDLFVNASNEYSDPEGAMLELYGTEMPLVRRFLSKKDLPKLKELLEKYLPEKFVPRFLKEESKVISKKQWWDYSELWSREYNKSNHIYYKCPICGNDDFILLKSPARKTEWDIESEMQIFGCTKCYYLLHFCEEAVWEAFAVEEESNNPDRKTKDIDNPVSYSNIDKRLEIIDETIDKLFTSIDDLNKKTNK